MNEKLYSLKQALLIYRGDQCYFQFHDVFENPLGSDKPPILGSGRPLTREALEALCKAVLPTLTTPLEFLEGNVLAQSQTVQGPEVWWSPPKVRPIFFGGQLKMKSGLAPWPGLIFASQNRELRLWAVQGERRPELSTRLYQAPLFNMTGESICLGSARKPDRATEHSAWEKALFQSAFSEIRKESRISGEEPLHAFWGNLIKRKINRFPEERLLPCKTQKTVKALLGDLKGAKP
jgi:PRTRC genetic system protein B